MRSTLSEFMPRMMSRLSPVHIVRFFQLAMPGYAAKPLQRNPRSMRSSRSEKPVMELFL